MRAYGLWLIVVAMGILLVIELFGSPAKAAVIELEGERVDLTTYLDTLDREPLDPTLNPTPAIKIAKSGCLQYAGIIDDYFPESELSKAISICECESEGDPNAVSPTNDHGLFQHNANSNPGQRFEGMGYSWSDRYDPRANIAAAYWLWDRSGWKPWTCNRLTGSREHSGEVIGVTIDPIAGPNGIESTATPVTVP